MHHVIWRKAHYNIKFSIEPQVFQVLTSFLPPSPPPPPPLPPPSPHSQSETVYLCSSARREASSTRIQDDSQRCTRVFLHFILCLRLESRNTEAPQLTDNGAN